MVLYFLKNIQNIQRYMVEPNKREYEIIKMHTDAFKSNIIEPTFKKFTIVHFQVQMQKKFYIDGPGASSLMGK